MLNLQTNQILNGDCLEILQTIPDKSIDLFFSDPPFNILNKPDIKLANRMLTCNCKFDDFPNYETYIQFIEQWIKLCSQKMKDQASFICFFATQYVTDLIRICEQLGMIRKNILIWYKLNPVPRIRKTNFLSSYESIVYMIKGTPHFNFLGQNNMHNCLIYPIVSQTERLKYYNSDTKKEETLHPTQKPLTLIEKIITIATNPKDIICDPFAGTGTINVAALNTNRYCVGIEKDLKYFNPAIKRLSEKLEKTKNTYQTKLSYKTII